MAAFDELAALLYLIYKEERDALISEKRRTPTVHSQADEKESKKGRKD